MASLNQLDFATIKKPPKVIGLVQKALIPMCGFVGFFLGLFILGQVVKGYSHVPLKILNVVGWLSVPATATLFLWLRDTEMRWVFISQAMVVGILAFLPGPILYGFLGWGFSSGILYFSLVGVLEKDCFALNVFEARFNTPPQNSNLAVESHVRRYV